MQKASVQPATTVIDPATSIESLMMRGSLFLEDGDWQRADAYFERILDRDPAYAPAYIGKLCVELQIRKEDQLANQKRSFDEMPNYQKALRFAQSEYKTKIVELYLSVKGHLDAEARQKAEDDRKRQEQIKEETLQKKATEQVELEYRRENFMSIIDILRSYFEELKHMQESEAQGLCPICGGKIGFFGKCKVCKTRPTSNAKTNILKTIVTLGRYDWSVIDYDTKNNKILLLCNDILNKTTSSYSRADFTWETCDWRKFLSDDFFNSFYDFEKQRILKSKIINRNNPWYGTNGGNETHDYVFLLSLEEVVMYFGDSGQLRNRPKKNYGNYYVDAIEDQFNENRAIYESCSVKHYRTGETITVNLPRKWWLRTPGKNSKYVVCVGFSGHYNQFNGDIDKCALGGTYTAGGINVDGSEIYGVSRMLRPALWLNLETK